MKKSNHPSKQKTLFQTWNKQKKKEENEGLFQTWDTSHTMTTNACTSTAHNAKHETEESFEDIIDIGDENDDNELLATLDQIELCENAKNSHDVGNLSFSASMNDDGSDIITGFDSSAGKSWIYPTNYPLRDYQFNIVQKALFHNTLVTLPTGLGKTFIAAVVMYNFYRWYPQGKIIFMAPTKPLVAQQIDACYNIMGIPRQDTAEMTGNMAPVKREQSWKQKRVFFLTPQVFQNDLSRGSCRADDVVCLVFDEAHKALGNHSYCQVVREVLSYTKNFRILALSATPGDGIQAVQQVITNLLVSHIELRSEDSVDIKPYTHKRQVEKIVVKLGDELEFFKTKFLKVLKILVNRLFSNQAIWQRDAQKVTKCLLLAAREQFRKKCTAGQQPRHQMGPIEGDFAVAMSLYHGYDLLLQHGLLPFYNFIKGIVDGSKGNSKAKTELTRNPDFIGILDDLRRQIELPSGQSDSNVRPNVNPSFVGHPKLVQLRDIVLEHFRACESAEHAGSSKGSRVMIFSQYRDSVQEISRMLSQYKPLVKAMSFIGQASKGNTSKGLTQKEQLQVLREFRTGGYNTLVATCVGEEGLDIGEVDLIVCFDASASPIRLVQRMGRTGRKRDGRIIVLVTEGKEEQIYQRSQRNKSNIHKTILESARTLDLYMENSRMVPKNVKPVCQKMFITMDAKPDKSQSKSAKPARKTTNGNGNIKKLFAACRSTSRKDDGLLSPEELRYWNDNFKLPRHEAGLTQSKSTPKRPRDRKSNGQRCLETEPALSLTEWTAWQTPLQQVYYVDHSKRSRHFTEILEFCDFRRDCGDSDDSYDLEMRSFLNLEDIKKPGAIGNGAKNKGERHNLFKKNEDEITNIAQKKDDGNNLARKGSEASGKRKSTDFGSDVDDDFEDDLCANNSPVKTEKNNKNNQAHCDLFSSFGQEYDEISSTRNQSSSSLTMNQSESSTSRTRNQSEFNLSSSKSQSKGRTSAAKNVSLHQSETNEEQSEFTHDVELGCENDLSELLEIPSSQRPRKVARRDAISEISLPDAPSLNTLLDLNAISEISIPDAPSLNTLLDISTVNDSQEDQSNLEEDEHFMPSMFTETTKTTTTYDNRHFVESSKSGMCKQRFSEKVSDIEDEKLGIKRGSISEKSCSSKKSEKVGKVNLEDNHDQLDRALCGIQTPCLFDDDEFEKTIERSMEITLNPRRATKHSSRGKLYSKDELVNTKNDNVQTPCLSDDDEFEKTIDRSMEQTLNPGCSTKHSSHGKLCSEAELVNTKNDNVQTPCLFDDDEFEKTIDRSMELTLNPRCSTKHSSHGKLCSEAELVDTKKNNAQTPILSDDDEFEKTIDRSMEQTLNPGCSTKHSSHGKLCSEAELVNTKNDNVQTPCLFDDDEFEKTIDRSMELTLNPRCSTKHSSHGKLCSEAELVDTKKNNAQTPILFDGDEFEKMADGNMEKALHPQRTPKQFPPGNLNSEAENANGTKNNNAQTPMLFDDDDEFENRNKTSKGEFTEPRSTSLSLWYSDDDNLRINRKGFGESINKLHVDTNKSQRKPLLEQNVDSNESTRPTSRMNKSSLNKIQSFSFAKPTTEQSKSGNVVTSEPRDKGLDLPEEYGHDVIGPTPYRVKSRNSICGKVDGDTTRSFRSLGVSLSMKSVCREKDNEMKTNRSRRTMLKLKGKPTEMNEDLKSRQGIPVDADMKLPKLELKSSSFKNNFLFGEAENKETESSPSPSGNKNNKLTAKVCLVKRQPTLVGKSSLKRTSSFAEDESKLEAHSPQAAEYLSSSPTNSSRNELTDEEIDQACLSPTIKSSSQFLGKGRDSALSHDLEGRKERNNKDKILKGNEPLGELNTSVPVHETLFEAGYCVERYASVVEDSPLVVKAKGKTRSKGSRHKPLESEDDSESGDENQITEGESGDEKRTTKYYDGEFGDKKQITKKYCGEFDFQDEDFDFQDEASVEEICDSDDDEFDQEPAKRKRKFPVHGQSKKIMPKKRRPSLNDFLDDEAEVSEDEMNGSHDSSEHEEGLDEMDDSFIDDRSQLTQRSPLTAMKEKKRDTSVNMMDIYRTSLLTPHRQQLRFQSPSLDRFKNRYKMVYNQPPPAGNISSSPTDYDDHHDVSMETEESDEVEDASMLGDGLADPHSVSPQESQIVVRRNRRGKRRVLAESPEAETTDFEHQTRLSPRSTTPKISPVRDSRATERGLGPPTQGSRAPTQGSRAPTQGSRVGMVNTGTNSSMIFKNSHISFTETDDAIFKRPGNTAPMNRGLNGMGKVSSGYSGDNENIEDILAALNDSDDDESIMMEISALSSSTTAFEDRALQENTGTRKNPSTGKNTSTGNNHSTGKNTSTEKNPSTGNNTSTGKNPSTGNEPYTGKNVAAGKNTTTESRSETRILPGNFTRKMPDHSLNNSKNEKVSSESLENSKPERTCGNTRRGKANTEILSWSKKPNLSRSLQLNTNSGTQHSGNTSLSSYSNTCESKQKSRNDLQLRKIDCGSHRTEGPTGKLVDNRSVLDSNTGCSVQQKSRITLHRGTKCDLSFQTTNSCETFRTDVNQSSTSLTCFKNNSITRVNNSAKLTNCGQNPKTKRNETLFKEYGIIREMAVNSAKRETQKPYSSELQTASNTRTENKSRNASPLFPPLSTTTSSRNTTSFTHVLPEKTTGQASCSKETKLDRTTVSQNTVNPSAVTSPALTAAERDKNKLTILVGSKEVSNCQIVSFLRRKHNIKAIVSQITGCDYIVSSRMAVERKLVSDISNQANSSKLTSRIRELCDLYDRPCIVIEKDRVKNGEIQVKCEVRSKYFDRILACLAQTHIKVLFSDSQEGTSDILASLAQVEEKKNNAIIYPLPLSNDKEQMVKFLSSIPRTSYITAISLCYHNKTLQELIDSSAEELVKRVKGLTLKRANDILKFFQHGFRADMVKSGGT